jgi:hypothetical protein
VQRADGITERERETYEDYKIAHSVGNVHGE